MSSYTTLPLLTAMTAAKYGSLPNSALDDSGVGYSSPGQSLLSRSVGSGTSENSSLISPIIGDEEVEEGSLQRSRMSLDRRRARLAASNLARESNVSVKSVGEDWFHVDNEHRRESHLTRCRLYSSLLHVALFSFSLLPSLCSPCLGPS